MATENLPEEDQHFLAQTEEELKDRYTEKDEEFMKVFNLEPSVPPIMENWYPSSGRRNNSRHYHPYKRNHDGGYRGQHYENRERGQGSYSHNRRGYNDYEDNHRSRYDRPRHY